MRNFDFLQSEPKFHTFADVAVAAEKILPIDLASSVINCRRAMEFAIKWLYSVDKALEKPWDDKLVNLMRTEEFREIVDDDLWNRLEFIRKKGNSAVHTGNRITQDEAMLCLENLYVFMDFIAYCYGEDYKEGQYFKPELVLQNKEINAVPEPIISEVDLQALIKENEKLKEELTLRREEQHQTYVPKPLDISEYKTRKMYIDTLLEDAGWVQGVDWLNEVSLQGMPNKSGTGRADYLLYGNDGRVLAVVEAKSSCKDVVQGRKQAQLYADIIEKKQGRRPVIFLTNGFDTRIIDGCYPERKVSEIYSKRDLERWFNLQTMRTSLSTVTVDKTIAGRYYQEAAVKAVCDAFDKKNRRKALLVMATGSGKTRTVIALCKVLLEHGWVRNILFLADRNSLVTQAKRSFVNLLPDLSVTNLCEEKNNYSAHGVFSTYQTMMNCIDSVRDEEGRLFTNGHFDLMICDEAHRSIYNKYKEIFDYFDAPLVGLTATPKDEVQNTYEEFNLEKGVPTYAYDLAQAVKDGYLVDYVSVETRLKFLEEGIVYDQLSKAEQLEYEKTFLDENGQLPERIESSALNEWLFNKDTIRQVLHILMTQGLKVDYGNKLGKTIMFAKNHRHAEKILEVFGEEYPDYTGYAGVIDNYTSYAQAAIDEFSQPEKLPQIAISVDMLDTGIDIPEVLNLVFFKKVMSKAKFWQMIGRGTRLCENLIDGKDKEKFYIFDFCNNFAFFRMSRGTSVETRLSLQGAIFNLEFEIAYKLQGIEYQTERLTEYRKQLVKHMAGKVNQLKRDNFAVRQHLRYVERFSAPENYLTLSYEDTLAVREELAHLIIPDEDDVKALRFDALMYGIELAFLSGKTYTRAKRDLRNKAEDLSEIANIPEIKEQSELIKKILYTDYLERGEIDDFENIRSKLRDLMKYIPVNSRDICEIDLTEEILSVEWNESELENDDLKDYKTKAEYYVRQHQDNKAILKLKENIPLTEEDMKELESILWSEVGSKKDYEAEYGSKPLGAFVREIVGLDMGAAKAAFAEFLDETNLDSRQIYFVNQIVEYIVHNGMMTDFSVLQEAPFTDRGSIAEVFTDLSVWLGIKNTIDMINANAMAAYR